MEPIITYEGYKILQDAQKSRDLLSEYYRSLGFQVITPVPAQNNAVAEKVQTQNNQAAQRP